MKPFRSALAVSTMLVISACAQVHNAQPSAAFPPFPTDEYSRLVRTGDATLTGQAFLKSKEGGVIVGAGSEIILIPATSYSRVFYEAYLRNQSTAPADSRVKQYTLKTQADANGTFRFTNVPAGRYYLAGIVTWEDPTQFDRTPQGGTIMKEVQVAAGSNQTVMLTK